MIKINTNRDGEHFVQDVITELQSNGYNHDQLAEITHCILNTMYDRKEDSRWEVKRKMFDMIYRDYLR